MFVWAVVVVKHRSFQVNEHTETLVVLLVLAFKNHALKGTESQTAISNCSQEISLAFTLVKQNLSSYKTILMPLKSRSYQITLSPPSWLYY